MGNLRSCLCVTRIGIRAQSNNSRKRQMDGDIKFDMRKGEKEQLLLLLLLQHLFFSRKWCLVPLKLLLFFLPVSGSARNNKNVVFDKITLMVVVVAE